MVVRAERFSARKLASLDGVRGLAILSVMLCHSLWRLNATTTPQRLFAWVAYQGGIGVDLFFVLSGFLITGILVDSRAATNFFQSFYARRVLRIFPLYYAFLLLAFCLFPFVIATDWLPAPTDRWMYWCYLTNWLALSHGPWRHNVMGHFWSLAVEEQFYLCWPLLVWLLKPAKLLHVLLIGEATLIVGRIWWVSAHGASVAVSMATLTRMDGLLLGSACAILIRQRHFPARLVRRLPIVAIGGVALHLVLAKTSQDANQYGQTLGLPILGISFATLVLYAALTDDSRGAMQSLLRWRGLTQMGKYSYGMYIFHVPIVYFIDRLIDLCLPAGARPPFWFGCATSAAICIVTFCLAKLSYTYFERYFLDWKDTFAPQYVAHGRSVQLSRASVGL